MSCLHVLSGGAAQGLVSRLEARFRDQTGCTLQATFGAVGAMKERLLGGEPCDVLILTQALVDGLIASGHVVPGSARPLGVVSTGVAVNAGAPVPRADTPDALKASLLAARGIYFPDPVKATAGIHFMSVLAKLGIAAEVAERLRPFPNGATAMREMAQAGEAGLIGCTQVTEILFTPGVELVGLLPEPLGLSTVYTAAVTTAGHAPEHAATLIDLLAGDDTATLRRAAGFA
jgi:molybdate transport system substrate-binding protein